MGEALKPEELETFRRLTERQDPPKERVSELVAVVGRAGAASPAQSPRYFAIWPAWSTIAPG